ncbi:hypothetical protein MLD38_036014 [Melastoma candidum]|uniref:Uncharacterized protein n=1 Tax=Melastoma candidum TaxID=119954 RepID=A0ACB9LHS5_9MYRT|nr:hypothetical protein MLD38_036014 [Melastoma candidum]
MQAREQVSIDVLHTDEELVRGLKEKMENISSSITICRVPEELHRGKTRDYYPDLVAIGPYHRGKLNLRDMEKHKWRYLFALLNRKPDLEANINECMKALRELEHRARRCYAGDIGLSSDEFVELMLVDGGFIIELLIKCAHKSLRRRGDPLFSTPGKLFDLRLDMILLENQIPLFVLQRLFQVSPIPKQCNTPLSELAFRFFKSMVPGGEQQDLQVKLNEEAHHLLDLVHNCLLPATFPREPTKQRPTQTPIKCATDLRASGIKIARASSRNLLDAKFTKGVLQIPPLNIDQCTGRLFRNLVALERCGCVDTPCITSYVFLIHGLIGSERDEKLLVDRQVITDSLNPGEVRKAHVLFNDICKDTNVQEWYYEGLSEQVNEYIERRRRPGHSSRGGQEDTGGGGRKEDGRRWIGHREMVVVGVLLLIMTSIGTLLSALSFFLHH